MERVSDGELLVEGLDRLASDDRQKLEAGWKDLRNVLLPKDAPWLADFLSELLSFPGGRHDDQVDSVSQFLIWFQQSAYQLVRLVAPIIVSAQRELYSYESYTAGNAALWASTSPY